MAEGGGLPSKWPEGFHVTSYVEVLRILTPSNSPRFMLAMAQRVISNTFECRSELGEWMRLYGYTLLGNGSPDSFNSCPQASSFESACFTRSVLSFIRSGVRIWCCT